MKYLCLVYREERMVGAMSKSEFDAFVGEHRAYDAVLRESGHGIRSEGLQPVQTATTVRVRHGKVYTTDGPFPLREYASRAAVGRRLTSGPFRRSTARETPRLGR